MAALILIYFFYCKGKEKKNKPRYSFVDLSVYIIISCSLVDSTMLEALLRLKKDNLPV